MMLVASVGLWLGVPLFWLYAASLVQSATDSVGIAMLVAFAGVLASIVVAVMVLGRLSDLYRNVAIARTDRDPGTGPLEAVFVCSAVLALTAVAVWFVAYSHSAPSPVPTG